MQRKVEKQFTDMSPRELAEAMQAGRVPSDAIIRGWQRTHPALWYTACDPDEQRRLLQPAATAAHPATGQRAAGQPATGRPAPREIAKALYGEDGRLIGAEKVFLDRETGAEIVPEPEPAKPKPAAKPSPATSNSKPATIAMVRSVLDGTKSALAEIVKRIEALEAGGATLQQRAGRMVFCGRWVAEETYEPGEYVNHDGGMWLCLARNEGARPGGKATSTYWRLSVKRGDLPE